MNLGIGCRSKIKSNTGLTLHSLIMTNFAKDRTKVNSETLVYQAHLSQRRHITTNPNV